MANFDENISESFHASMEGLCLELLHQGYEAMIAAKAYQLDWKEDKLTVHYIACMNRLAIRKEHQISINAQFIIYSDAHAFEEDEVDTAPRIDFKFSKWQEKTEIDYFAEAKNVSEKDWKKRSGAFVSASYYYKRYIETGISHLVTGYYPHNCFLIAYIVNGDKNEILAHLNTLIKERFKDYGVIYKPEISFYEEYYLSENVLEGKCITLKHLFLQLPR